MLIKEKVNWRKEYKYDNLVNVIFGILAIAIFIIPEIPNNFIGFPLGLTLFINISAMRFFTKKYE